MQKIGIINLSSNNLNSVKGVFEKIGCDCYVINNAHQIQNSDLVVLPGVGVFPEAIKNLEKNKLKFPLIKAAKNGQKILGICLGMQILTESSEEIDFTKGLALIPGKIKKMKKITFNIGWSKNKFLKRKKFSFLDGSDFYYNHQFKYYGPSKYIFSYIENNEKIPSVIIKKNIIGVQFHPEKSQLSGIKFLKKLISNFP